MHPTREEFTAHYGAISELELLDLAQQYDSLTESAQSALRAEFAKRGLAPPIISEPAEFDARNLVTLRRYRDLPEAMVARSLLMADGIEAWIQDENLIRIDWGYSNAIGGIRLQVDARDEATVEAILTELPVSIPLIDETEYFSLDARDAVPWICGCFR